MNVIFMILPFILVLSSSFYFNKERIKNSKKYLIMVSLIHGLISYTIIMILFLSGFITGIIMFIIICTILLASLFAMYAVHKAYIDDIQAQVITLINNILFFLTTLFPLYIFLVIFRYQNNALQIIYSALLAASVYYFFFLIRKFVFPSGRRIFDTLFTWRENAKILIPFCSILLILIIFNFPTNVVSKTINLSNQVRYLAFEEYHTTINNDFTQEIVLQVKKSDNYSSKMVGYRYTNETLEILSYNNGVYKLQELDIETGDYLLNETVYEGDLERYTHDTYSGDADHGTTTIISGDLTYNIDLYNRYNAYILIEKDNEEYSYFEHEPLQKFIGIFNYPFHKVDVYRLDDETVEFLQQDGNVYTVYRLVQKESTSFIPNSSHYALSSLLWVVIGSLFPFIGPEVRATEVSHEQAMNGKYIQKEKDEK